MQPQDHDKPNLQWKTPPEVSSVNWEITLSVSANDPTTSVSSVTFTSVPDGTEIGTDRDGPEVWDTTWNTESAPDGEFIISATAVDEAGNERTKKRTVTIDNSLPVIEVVAPKENQHIQGNLDPNAQNSYKIQWCLATANPMLASDPFSLDLRTSQGESFTPIEDSLGDTNSTTNSINVQVKSSC